MSVEYTMASTGPAGAGAGPAALRDPTPEEEAWLLNFIRVRYIGAEDLRRWYAEHPNVRIDTVEDKEQEYPTVYAKVLVRMSHFNATADVYRETLRRKPNPLVTNERGQDAAQLLGNYMRELLPTGQKIVRPFYEEALAYKKEWTQRIADTEHTRDLVSEWNVKKADPTNPVPRDVTGVIASYLSGKKGTYKQQYAALKGTQGGRRRHRRGRKTRRRHVKR